MRLLDALARPVAIAGIATALMLQTVSGQQPARSGNRPGRSATPTAVSTAPTAAPLPAPTGASKTPAAAFDPQRLLAGHYLRRMGFGPSPKDMATVLKIGPAAYIEQQLNPSKIDDSAAEAKLPPEPPNNRRGFYDDYRWRMRWYTRMVFSKRQLQEKMTLIWHEHFAVSNRKVGVGNFMHDYEELLRRNSLGSFRTMLSEISRDQAMLRWLDNDPNNGQATDDEGNPIPPNENYARELLQLFSMGPTKLNMDGTPVLGADGQPVPAYTETDVREVARALTGWSVDYHEQRGTVARFYANEHDPNDKNILGVHVTGLLRDGAKETDQVVDIIMQQSTVAPFISKELIQKLATETPSPAYVARVAGVFAQTSGDLRATVRAILTDPEFTAETTVRSQYKEPIEQFVGPIRALEGKTRGGSLVEYGPVAKQGLYYPPSVFSFYRPGQKGALVNSALATIRDTIADAIVSNYGDTSFDTRKLASKYRLTTPDQIVDYLSDALLAAPLDPEVRQRIVTYMGGRTDEERFRGAVWLVLCTPDYQRN